MARVDWTILIVNDSLMERELYQRYLLQETIFVYDVWEAESKDAALRLCCQQLPNVILLDYFLPDGDGLQFLLDLKTRVGENCPPIIMLNNLGNETVAIRAFKAGVEDYLIKKDVTAESLRYITRTAIDNFQFRQNLRASDERYRAIVEDQTELICRFLPDCTLTFVNQAYSRYFNSTPDTLIGQNFLNLIPESYRSVVQQQITELSMAKTENAVINQEHPVLKPNGEIGWQQWTDRAIFDKNGQLVEFQAVGRDISAQKQVETALRESEQRLLAIIDNSKAAIFLKDMEGRYLLMNHECERLFKITNDWIRGKTDYDIFPKEIADTLRLNDQQVINNGAAITLEEEVPFEDGIHTYIAVKFPLFDSAGVPYAICGISTDITERARLQAERDKLLIEAQVAREVAESANRSKDEFIAMVAHELRSPINSVAGWVKLLQMREFDAATTKRALEAIERGTQTQVQLIEDLLDISRLVRGALRLTFAPVNLMTVIQSALETVRPMADSKQIYLETQFAANVQVSGDENRLQQILVNLLTNAIKFTPKQGLVTVVLELVEEHVQIQVSDTGKGISAEFLPQIFERFQQAQQNTGAKDGLGLGLAIVKNLVELHNGTVTAHSSGIGRGATFTVKLPLLAVAPSTVVSEVPMVSDVAPLTGMRVLAVDDEPDSLSLLQFILEDAGAEVLTASNGLVALELLPQFNPNLIVSDISMPEMSGHELLQKIRTLHPNLQIPAIALTAYASSSDKEYALRLGFEQYFSKPVEPENLIQGIVNLITQLKQYT